MPNPAPSGSPYTAAQLSDFSTDLRSIAERMAEIIVERAFAGLEGTTNLDLLRAGFTEREVLRHHDEAIALACRRCRRSHT